jgi:3-oxoacyl-[acyl-carrier-protein] synthase-1
MAITSSASPCSLVALGMVNALGRDADQIWKRLLAADQSHFRIRDDLFPEHRLLLGEVEGALPEIPGHLHRYACRNNALTLAALEQIEAVVAEVIDAVGRARVGVVMGTSTSGVSDAEAAIRHRERTGHLAEEFEYDQLEFGGTAGFVAHLLDLGGPAYTISTACSSGARALASARALLALDLCDAVIAGATDSICGLTTNGFSALQVVSNEVSNPCSANRSGLTLGEGSAVFLVMRDRGGVQLLGVGESSDAHHMSAPDPDGAGAQRAMEGALRDARMGADEIAYINLHGTGTELNDAMECAAIGRIFHESPPCSSTKPLVGHTLGAAGAMEAGFCWLTLHAKSEQRMTLIPHAYDGVRVPQLAPVALVGPGERVPVGPIMSNSFGFGGNNCTLVLGGEGA